MVAKHNVPILVLVGPHQVGKTTLGRRLSSSLGIPFDEEIGRQMRDELLAESPKNHAMVCDARFDRAVFEAELKRDRRMRGSARIVETWHVGNLAYAMERSPGEAVRAALELERFGVNSGGPVWVQPLVMSRAQATLRLDEPGPSEAELVDFFERVSARCEPIAQALGCQVLPAVDTSLTSVRAAEAEIMLNLLRVASGGGASSVPFRSVVYGWTP